MPFIPANQTVYPTAPTKYFCGKNGAQKDIYWWSPSISGENRSNSGCTEIGFAAGDVQQVAVGVERGERAARRDAPELLASARSSLRLGLAGPDTEPSSGDGGVDAGDQLRVERTRIGRGHALGQLLPGDRC